jgi:hypothetical protein
MKLSRVAQFLIFTLLMMGVVLGSALLIARRMRIEMAMESGEWFTLVVICAGHGYLWINRAIIRGRRGMQSRGVE